MRTLKFICLFLAASSMAFCNADQSNKGGYSQECEMCKKHEDWKTGKIEFNVAEEVMFKESSNNIYAYIYTGLEGRLGFASNLILGARFYSKDYLTDVNVGFLPLKNKYSRSNMFSADINVSYIFIENDNSKYYLGIGNEYRGYWVKSNDSSKFKVNSWIPKLLIGKDFPIGKSSRAFFEITYSPYTFISKATYRSHALGYRVGLGF